MDLKILSFLLSDPAKIAKRSLHGKSGSGLHISKFSNLEFCEESEIVRKLEQIRSYSEDF